MSREAMQMALEALESDPISHVGLVSRKQAITTLRQALVASQERVDEKAKREHEWVWLTDEPKALRLADALDAEFVQGRISNSTGRESAVELRRLHEALETEQEPVLWLKTWPDGSVSVLKTKSHAFADHELEPLYAAPPKQWVGLTDDAAELRRLHEVNQDLLKALNTILNICLIDNGHWAKTIEREAHEAIAKATGEKS